MTVAPHAAGILAGYVPRLVEHHRRVDDHRRLISVAGTLVSADISGFTALSERLAALGHEGAEQLTDLLNRCFSAMIDACESRGGDVIKFGGDALLVLFSGERHQAHAAVAMSTMRSIVSRNWSTDSVKRISLGISQGAHSGTFDFSLVDVGHFELLVGGPSVSTTVSCESEAERGQILVSAATAAALPDDWLGPPTPSGARPLKPRRVLAAAGEFPTTASEARGTDGLDAYLPADLVDQLIVGVPGEHRQVVVAFVHIGGVDGRHEREGSLAVHEAYLRIGDHVREILGRHPVHLLASDTYVDGTKLILTAGAPVSTDADEDHLLLALNELFGAELPLPIRAGVNRGHVFVGHLGGPTRGTFTVMGDAVNLAARLMQHASPGQVVVADAVLGRTRTAFDATPLEPFSVKGKSRPIVASVLGAPRADEADDQVSHIGHVGFVGRVNELSILDSLADGAAHGHGSLVEVSGDPGIGKSRLVREIVHRHPELMVHRMRGGQYARQTPFLAMRRLIMELIDAEFTEPRTRGAELTAWVERFLPEALPWLPLLAIVVGGEVAPTDEVDLLAEQFRRDRLLAVTADLVDAALDAPTVIVAEDVHLFDTGSLDVLALLGGRAHSRPWLILTTLRPPAGVITTTTHSIVLDNLDGGEVSELVTAAGAMLAAGQPGVGRAELARLAERAGGNPLFLIEMVSAADGSGGDALPESVESLVTTRIDQLPAGDRRLLREASVSGNVIDLPLIAAAFDRPELADDERWSSLSPFLVDDEEAGRRRFRHAIYRDVAYAGLSYRRRREAHLAIGTALEARSVDARTQYAPLLSVHFDQGKDRSRAWRYAVLGGDAARGSYANHEAITLYERALDNATEAHTAPTDRARVAEALGDVRELSGQYPDAIEAYQRSRSIARDLEPEREVRLLRKIGTVRLREGQLSQALRWISRARTEILRIADPGRRELEQAEAALVRSGALHRQGRNQQSATWAETAAQAADASGDRLVRARAYNMLEVTHRTLNRRDAPHFSDLALEMYEGSGDLVGEANVLNNRGVRHYFAGRWTQSVEDYERSRNLCRQAGDVAGEALVTNNIAEILCLQGHFDAARRLFLDAKTSWETAGNAIGVAYVTANLAMVDARSGLTADGLTLIERAQTAMDELRSTTLADDIELRRIECLLLAGGADEALDRAERLRDRVGTDHEGVEQIVMQLDVLTGIAHVRRGHRQAATEALSRALHEARELSDHYHEAVTLLAGSLIGVELGDDPATQAALARSLLTDLGVVGTPGLVRPRGLVTANAPVGDPAGTAE